MMHGVDSRESVETWCGLSIYEVGGWIPDADEVECIECLRIRIAKQQAVVDAARTQRKYHDKDCVCVVCLALDGEPCPNCVSGIAPKGGNEGSTRYVCPTCGGCGYLPTDTPHTDQTCRACCGTGRKPCPSDRGLGLKP